MRPNPASFADCDSWIDHAAGAENDVVANVTSGADDGAGSDLRASLDHGMWLDRNALT